MHGIRALEQLFQTKCWQVHVPEGWTALAHSPEMATLYSPKGIGLLEFIQSEEPYEGAGSERFGELHGEYLGKKVHRGIYRRFWQLSCMGKKLSVSYNCSAEHAELEHAVVDEVLRSLEQHSETA